MKLKVKSEFFDKYTNELYEIGRTLEVDKARGDELLATSLVELIEEKKVVKKTTKE